MSDSVKFIFKTLIKVPMYIFIAFFAFNIFAFIFIYFKMLGISYVVMQTAAENNYLPASELITLYDYVDNLNEIEMVTDAKVVVGISNDGYITMNNATDTAATAGDIDARTRKQYGNSVTCGVRCDFTIVWPLDVVEQTEGETGVDGWQGDKFTGFKDGAELENKRQSRRIKIPLYITYTIPGLKYYPDMLT